MRLIDADKLAETLKVSTNDFKEIPISLEAILNFIDNAPTVTPTLQFEDITDEDVAKFAMIWQRATSKGLILEPERPQGRWIKEYKDFKCSLCGKIAYSWNNYGTHIQIKSNFCPHCGADMRGDTE